MGPSLTPSRSVPPQGTPLDAACLAALARETRRRIDWDRILVLRGDTATGEASPWKWVENARNFAIYTKTERGVHAVLAVGTVKASANEIAALLTASSTREYAHKMEALHEDDYRDAAFLYGADRHAVETPDRNGASPARLSVRSLTFAKPRGSWLASHDAWCHLHAVYEDRKAHRIEQVLTTMRPQDVPSRGSKPSVNVNYFREGVIAACRIDEQIIPHTQPAEKEQHGMASSHVSTGSTRSVSGSRQRFTSRVHFYAEMPQHASWQVTKRGVSSDKATKQRLYLLAKNCHRLSLLIRRRRLGVQALVGRTRFLPPTDTPCFCCNTHLLIAKLCRVCGQGVCRHCSDKYERETAQGIATVRVCDPCLDRVESADYSATNEPSHAGPRIVEDEGDEHSAEADLRYLLREALVKAKSPEHQASVMNVIRSVLDQDYDETEYAASSGPTTPQFVRSVDELTHALDDLRVEPVRHDEAVFRSNEDRTYRMDTRKPGVAVVVAPIPDNEDERLQAVAQVDIEQLGDSVELAILSELAAAEMGCSMSTISIFDRDTLHCVGTNVEGLRGVKLPRSDTLCAHTILDTTPNLVVHPEADIRFANSAAVQKMGARFYFAFPITDGADQVLGSFCVMNDTSVEVTETKYAGFKKLAETCNKVVRIHTEQRRRQSSARSTTS